MRMIFQEALPQDNATGFLSHGVLLGSNMKRDFRLTLMSTGLPTVAKSTQFCIASPLDRLFNSFLHPEVEKGPYKLWRSQLRPNAVKRFGAANDLKFLDLPETPSTLFTFCLWEMKHSLQRLL
jgi:hypothetical protein